MAVNVCFNCVVHKIFKKLNTFEYRQNKNIKSCGHVLHLLSYMIFHKHHLKKWVKWFPGRVFSYHRTAPG